MKAAGINQLPIESHVLQAFVSQYYLRHQAPRELVVNGVLPDKELLIEVLSQRAGRRVEGVQVSGRPDDELPDAAFTDDDRRRVARVLLRESPPSLGPGPLVQCYDAAILGPSDQEDDEVAIDEWVAGHAPRIHP